MRERLAVRPRQRCGLSDQCGGELHRFRCTLTAEIAETAEKYFGFLRALCVLCGKTFTSSHSEGQLGERPAFAFHHLEAENLRNRRRDIQSPDRAWRADG